MLELKNLKFGYSEETIIQDMNMQIRQGEIISLIGPSGCGKTSLLKLIAGFYSPLEGKINNPFSSGILLSENSLLPWRNVWQNLIFPLEISGDYSDDAIHQAMELMKLVDLTDQLGKLPSDLSTGMKQRVALAQLLLHDPELFLLDEPLSATDYHFRLNFYARLRARFKLQKKTVFMVTHNLEDALIFSDRICVFDSDSKKIDDILNIDIPDKFRSPEKIRYNTNYNDYYNQLWLILDNHV